MMKYNKFFNSLLALGALATLASCSSSNKDGDYKSVPVKATEDTRRVAEVKLERSHDLFINDNQELGQLCFFTANVADAFLAKQAEVTAYGTNIKVFTTSAVRAQDNYSSYRFDNYKLAPDTKAILASRIADTSNYFFKGEYLPLDYLRGLRNFNLGLAGSLEKPAIQSADYELSMEGERFVYRFPIKDGELYILSNVNLGPSFYSLNGLFLKGAYLRVDKPTNCYLRVHS